jgi:hypothetical protein
MQLRNDGNGVERLIANDSLPLTTQSSEQGDILHVYEPLFSSGLGQHQRVK